jgi:single-strand DNA-binding protein
VVADEVGPSIRWATAQVTKNERRGPGDGGPQGGAGGRSGPAVGGTPAEPQGYGYSEEPF